MREGTQTTRHGIAMGLAHRYEDQRNLGRVRGGQDGGLIGNWMTKGSAPEIPNGRASLRGMIRCQQHYGFVRERFAYGTIQPRQTLQLNDEVGDYN